MAEAILSTLIVGAAILLILAFLFYDEGRWP